MVVTFSIKFAYLWGSDSERPHLKHAKSSVKLAGGLLNGVLYAVDRD